MPDSLNPNSLTVEAIARMLSRAGNREVMQQAIQDDIKAGAPTNPDGTLNLVHYTAWNVQQYSQRHDGT